MKGYLIYLQTVDIYAIHTQHKCNLLTQTFPTKKGIAQYNPFHRNAEKN